VQAGAKLQRDHVATIFKSGPYLEGLGILQLLMELARRENARSMCCTAKAKDACRARQ
jgi:hypothetical protein